MDSDEGKLFVGGIAWDTTEETLSEYFSSYGEVSQTVIMRDKTTGRPRGFGFVVFSDPSVLDRVVEDKHSIDGRMVEAKKALSRDEQHSSSRPANAGRNPGGGGNLRTKKIFVGGLPSTLTEDEFRMYFESYGRVADVVIMYDQTTQRPRGFGFISFETEEAVDQVVQKSFHELNNKLVEVKKALPKDANPGGGGRGGYQGGYGGSNTNSFDGRVDSNRYMQPQTTPGGFPPYSGYGAPSYGYGAASNAMGYGGYGSYAVAGAGFGAPAGAYGNPNAPGAGYGSGAPGAMKSNWSGQTPSGYGYGASAGYGSAGPWNASGGGGGVSAPMGQSPGGASGYGSQGYGYGGYGGSAPDSDGSAGGEHQGGGGYGDSNGSGYSNTTWRSDPSQAAGGYGGGYGSAHPRQSQQQ